MGFISILLFWGLLIYFIVIKDGADFMSKYNFAFRNMPKNKTIIKLFHILMVLFGLIALLLGNKFMGGIYTKIK